MDESAKTSTKRNKGVHTLGAILIALVLLALLSAGGTWLVRSMDYVSTDDAQIKADIITVSPETPGRIVALTKEEGEIVGAGEVVAKLDSEEIRIQIREANAEIQRTRSRWLETKRDIELYLKKHREKIALAEAVLRSYRHDRDEAQAEAEVAREDWHRTEELLKRTLISKQEASHGRSKFRQTWAQLASLEEKINQGRIALELARIEGGEVSVKRAAFKAREAELNRAQENLANLERKLDRMTIRSPVTGSIAKREALTGEFVQPGQPIFMVVDSSKYWVEANVEETKIRFVKPGARALVRMDSYPGLDYSGKVLEIGEATVSAFTLFSPAKLTGVFIKSTQRIPVKIHVENDNGDLKLGMLAVVWIEKDAVKDRTSHFWPLNLASY